jgi:hypothetical protein
MTQPTLYNDPLMAAAGPLRPIEWKLAGWGIGLGLALLSLLAFAHTYLPAQL